MTEESEDFEMWAGDSQVININIFENTGVRRDITNDTVRWVLSDSAGDEPKIEKSTDGSGINKTSPSEGEVEVKLDKPDTNDIYGRFHHEAEIIDDQGRELTVMTGSVKINRSST